MSIPTNNAIEEGITRHTVLWAEILSMLSRHAGVNGYRSLCTESDDGEEVARITSKYMTREGKVVVTETVALTFMWAPVNDV